MLDVIYKYNSEIIEKIISLNKQKKCILLLSNIIRQKKLVENFDEVYNENLLSLFNKTINKGTDFLLTSHINNESVNNILNNLESSIPDTDNYEEIEATFAQNAIISLVYYFQFYIEDKESDFEYCINKVLDTLDVINYNKDKNYDESKLIESEIKILQSFLKVLSLDLSIENLEKFCYEIANKNIIIND